MMGFRSVEIGENRRAVSYITPPNLHPIANALIEKFVLSLSCCLNFIYNMREVMHLCVYRVDPVNFLSNVTVAVGYVRENFNKSRTAARCARIKKLQ